MKLAFEVTEPPGDGHQNLPPIILLHGMMDSRKTWRPVTEDLARNTGRRVFAVDARNHGESPWSGEFDFDILTDDLDRFMDERGIPRAILVGHSMGGKTAITLALKKPEKVEKLIVEDMIIGNLSREQLQLVQQSLPMLRDSLDAIPAGADDVTARRSISKFFRDLSPSDLPQNISDDLIPVKRVGDGYDWEANLEIIEESLTVEKRLDQNLSGVYLGEALFLHGTTSFIDVLADALIPKFFPQVEFRAIEGAGHDIHADFTEDFLREVSHFIVGK